MVDELEHDFILTNGVRLHLVQSGPSDGPLVILLHGFPEFWYGWRHQIPFLANKGYRVWAPDQRGYNLSDKPNAIADYRLDILASDILGLMDAAGRKNAFLIGHDWGGAVVWRLASKFPDRIERAVILNVPHPAVMIRHLRHSPRQLLRSWYVFYFQLPWIPERLARIGNFAAVARALQKTSRPGTFDEADLARYREAWRQPHAFRGMLHWYRAARYRFEEINRPIETPTLLIWGVNDAFLSRHLAPESIGRCRDGKLVFLDEAGHFVQHEQPQRVNELIRDFLQSSPLPD
jgi:pimeloyl-ACP methyl ester carboxylesterase